MPHRRRDAPGGLGLSLGLRVGGPRLGGSLPKLFSWKPLTSGPGTLPVSATFARSSDAYYFNGSQYVLVGSNVIRDQHKQSTGGSAGYLSEPAATNLVTDADDLTAGSWSNSNITPTDQGSSGIGLPAWRLDAGTATGSHIIFDTIASSGDGSCSLRAKAITGQYLTIRTDTSGSSKYAVFDLVNGTVTENVVATFDIVDLGNGWYDCQIHASSNTQRSIVIGISNTATPGTAQPSFTGSNETIDVAVPQSEGTLFTTSPIVSSGVEGVRGADTIDTGVAIPATGYTAFCDVAPPLDSEGFTCIGTTNNRSPIGRSAITEYNAFLTGRNISIAATWDARSKLSTSNSNTVGGVDPLYLSATGETTRVSTSNGVDIGNFTIGNRSGGDQTRGLIYESVIYDGEVDQATNESLVA